MPPKLKSSYENVLLCILLCLRRIFSPKNVSATAALIAATDTVG
jgi:hypothetical protein